jgi:putative ABC transport system permease protein
MPTLLADLKYGFRMLLSTPRVTIAALCSLALGIGGTTAIFTVVNAVILRPLPFTDPGRLVAIWETAPDNDRRWVAPANFLDWRHDARSFTGLAAYDRYSVNLTGRERPERLRAASVSGNIWSLLGVQAELGRTFTEAQDAPGAEPAVVLTHAGWQRLFGADQTIVGRSLVIDARPHTVVGVLPDSFDFFGSDIDVVVSGDRAIPRSLPIPGDLTQVRDAHVIDVLGRLRSGVSVEQAQAEMTTIMRRLEQTYPRTNHQLGARVIPLQEDIVAESRTALLLLLGAVGLMLLIACVNVANLLLARAVARQREMGIRVSLGAGRARLVRQVLTETALLGVIGGALGVALAAWGVDALLALAPDGIPRSAGIHIDPATVLVAAILSLGTALLFGLAPALHATSPRLHQAIHAETSRVSEGRSQRRMQQALVVSELTLAQVLVAGAALLIASFVNVHNVDLGFNPDHVLAVELTMPMGKYKEPERKLAFNRAVLEKLEALPGVRSAAATLTVPLRGAINRGVWLLDRPEPPPGQQPDIDFMIVSAAYFRTLGIPLIAGRTLSEQDTFTSPRVAVISQTMARRYWPGGNALGQRVRFGGSKIAEVVGVVGDVRQRDPARAPEPLLYIPFQQDVEPWNFIAFALRVQGDPEALSNAVREAVLTVDPDQPVARIRAIDDIADTLLAGRRFNTILLTLFSAVAVLLAAIGTYGVMAYSVSRRTREIGVRAALGARPSDVMRMVLAQGAGLVATAIGIGLAAALATNRLLSQQLFEVSATDPGTLATGAVVLSSFALLACYIPARRAMRIEPIQALRED